MRRSQTQTFKPDNGPGVKIDSYSTFSSRRSSFESPDGWVRLPDNGEQHPLHYIAPIVHTYSLASVSVNKNELSAIDEVLPAVNEKLATVVTKQFTPPESPMNVVISKSLSSDTSLQFAMDSTKNSPTISPMASTVMPKEFSFSELFKDSATAKSKYKTAPKPKT